MSNKLEKLKLLFDKVEHYEDCLYICVLNGKCRFYNINNNKLTYELDAVTIGRGSNWIIFLKDGKRGILNKELEITVQPEYDMIHVSDEVKTSDGRQVYIVLKDNHQGIVASDGEVLLAVEYEYVASLKNGCYIVRNDDYKTGLYNIHKKSFVIQMEYAEITKFIGDTLKIAKEQNGNKIYGVVGSESGKLILPIEYYWLSIHTKDICIIGRLDSITNRKYVGLLDFRTKREILPMEYDVINRNTHITNTNNSISIVKRGIKQGVIEVIEDKSGNVTVRTVIPLEYFDITKLAHGLYKVTDGEKYGLIDYNGKIHLDTIYDSIVTVMNSNEIVAKHPTGKIKKLKYVTRADGMYGNAVIVTKEMLQAEDDRYTQLLQKYKDIVTMGNGAFYAAQIDDEHWVFVSKDNKPLSGKLKVDRCNLVGIDYTSDGTGEI